MLVVYFLLLCIALLIFYMLKQANEHHIVQHTAVIKGKRDFFRVLFISDVHNRYIQSEGLNKLGALDAVIIGGDLCDRRTKREKLEKNLMLLNQFGPIFFVWGNNDREFGEVELRQIFNELKVTVVENDAVSLNNRQNTTWISAIDDTSTKNYDFNKALSKCKINDVVLCVSHNPQVFQKARRIRVPSMFLGGHLHGGQIRLGKYGLHPHGSFSVRNGVPTLISNGYGTTLVPLRLGAKPQIHVIDIKVRNE